MPSSLNMSQVNSTTILVIVRYVAKRRKQATRKGNSVDAAAMIGVSRAATTSWVYSLGADGLADSAGAATAAGLVDGAVARGLRPDVRPPRLTW